MQQERRDLDAWNAVEITAVLYYPQYRKAALLVHILKGEGCKIPNSEILLGSSQAHADI